MLPDSFRLSNLCYGHEGKYICSLKGRFDPQLVNEPIQLGQLSCGCWIVLDGNNRIGLILKHNIKAKIGEFPKNIFTFFKNKEFDEGEIYYWNPYPKTFGYILPLSKQLNIVIKNKKSFKSEADYQNEVNKITSLLTKKMHPCPARAIPGLTRRYSRPRTTPLRSAARGRLRLVVVPEKQETAMELRKLSDIIIEIAKQGLSCEKYSHSKVMHALMALAHIAWNRETVSESYTPREQYIGFINQLRLSAKSIRRELVSEDWEAIISRMRAYKRQHFQNDRSVITACGFTERETLQVQWHDGAQQTHQRGK